VPDRKPGRSYGETFGSSSFTGQVTMSLPLPEASAARLTPGLSLDYAHGGANGPFGLGMSLSLPTLSRRLDSGIPRYTDADSFVGPDGQELTPGFDADGHGGWVPVQRSVTQDGVAYSVRLYRTRIDGNASRIEQWTGPAGDIFWTVRDRNNGVTTFGRTPTARIADPEAPWRVSSWLPEEHVDSSGDRVVFVYKAEDNEGWPGASFPSPAQRYIAEIRYGNYRPADSTEESFAFSMVFDYGEYDPLSGHAAPVRPWPARSDPQTSFRTGFPVQTLRLCQTIFSVNHLPEAAIDGPLVDEVLSLTYSDPSGQMLTRVRLTGQNRAPDGTLRAAALPPLTLDYAPFSPDAASWRKAAIAGTEGMPQPLGGALLSFADLHGEGLPGIVFAADSTLSYAPPLGGGSYGALEPLPMLPSAATAPGYALRDLAGTGHLSLVATTPDHGGYFFNRNDGGWNGFLAFPSYAPEAAGYGAQWADLDGDGMADLLVAAPDQTRVYLSRGRDGFAPALTLPPKRATADIETGDEPVLRTFADMFGDGLEHRVNIASGRVEVWPNLGYGQFGGRIGWANAPAFGPEITADRILLGSFSGGSTDLLLVYPDHGELYPNAGITGFGAAIRIDFPCLVDRDCTVAIADLLGTGYGCLVISQRGASSETWYLDFCGDAFPGLMNAADNGIGGFTRIAYRSSTAFYLADRERGEPWLTRLPMPVVVVERLDQLDAVNGVANSEQHQYRDGYFDPVERRFRGFGCVQSINARAASEELWSFPGPASSADPIGGAAQLVRTWSYTGAFVGPANEIDAYRPRFFAGDSDALEIGPSLLAPPLRGENSGTVRDATAALGGSPIRVETWSVGADGAIGAVPLLVEQHSGTVTMLQPRFGEAAASVMLTPRESAVLHYEGVADDPRTEQEAVLDWDSYGNPTLSAAISYARRTPQTPEQAAIRSTARRDSWVNRDEGSIFLIGILFETADYELAGLAPDQGRYLSYDMLKEAVGGALDHPVDYGKPFGSGKQSRLFGGGRSYFWNEAQDAPLPLGECGPRPLVHHDTAAVFPPSFVADAYGAAVTDAMLQAGGLQLEAGLWWAPGDRAYYAGAEGYYRPIGFQTPFQTDSAHTVLGYDAYWLFAIRSTDALGFTTTMIPDYQALEPWSVTDANGMTTQGLYGPLKRLALISQHALVEGQWQGGMDLANYQPKPIPDLAALVADPMAYLQGAQGLFLRGYAEWTGAGSQPSYVASVAAMANCNSPAWPGDAEVPPGVRIGYHDGFGRNVEQLERVETPATNGAGTGDGSWTWRSVARIDYDHNDRVLRTYLPAFQDGPDFRPAGARAFTSFQYDALDRQVRTDTAKGFVLLSRFPDAWTAQQWDADDTVLQSPYYQAHIDDPNLPPPEKRALEQAAALADTPTSGLLDPQGGCVRVDEINVEPGGSKTTLSTSLTLDIRGLVTKTVDPRLSHLTGAFNVAVLYDMLDRPVRFTRADAGDELVLRDAAGGTIFQWTALGDRIETVYATPIRRPLKRLLRSAAAEAEALIATFDYGTDPAAQTVNRLVRQHDQAGVQIILAYDIGGRKAKATRQFAEAPQGLLDWSKTVPLQAAVWPQGWRYDPGGRLIEEQCADGSKIGRHYFSNGWPAEVDVTPAGAAGPTAVETGLVADAYGQPTAARYGDGVALAWAYDPLTGELVASSVSSPADASSLQDLNYFYDPQGNVSTIVDGAAAALMGGAAQPLEKQFTFDGLYRLTEATGWEEAPGTPPWHSYRQSLAYDPGGNLTAIAGSGAAIELSVAATSNRAVASSMVAPGRDVDSFFDPAGNLLALADGMALAYDFDDRLASATPTGAPAPEACYRYGLDGIRLRKALAESDVYRLGAAYVEVGGSVTRTSLLVPGAHGDMLFVAIDGTKLRPSYLVTDRLGSVTLELGADGGVQRFQDYYPYGGFSVALQPASPDLPARLAFAGKERDGETGLSYFGGRYYIAGWGRWLTADPMGEVDGPNLYAYVEGNPITFTDPTGFGKSDKVKMHGKWVVKPSTHSDMHLRSEKLGETIAKEIVASTTDYSAALQQMDKEIALEQQNSGLPEHNESKVDEAMKAGMRGDKEEFNRLYRAALPGMDEQISTATMYNIAKGAGKVTMSKAQKKQFKATFRIASRLRLETEYSGYATKHGEAQHTTSKGSEFFTSTGKGHTYWDRARREDVLEKGETTANTGVNRMLDMIAEAGRHSLSFGVAPSRGRNITTYDKIRKAKRKRQMYHREGVKRIVLRVLRQDPDNHPTQRGRRSWKPDRRRSLSPGRRGYY
jgi:RHS repeat-associated protein